MLRRFVIIFSVLFIFTMGWWGCSENNSTVMTIIDDNTTTENTVNYFPLDEGQTYIYDVTYSNGTTEELTFRVGSEVPFGITTAMQWFIESSVGSCDTNYIITSNSAVYLYANYQAVPEQLLSYPLLPGSSWTRYVTTETVINDLLDDEETDNTETEDDNEDTDDNLLLPAYPTTGTGDMVVENSETILLNSGTTLSGSVRVRNNSTTDLKNYYWYTPGIGLVKYIIGTTDLSYPNGQIVGELVSYN